jgi:predicted Zn-ribbon and HTH transcriptional regulator
MIEPQPKQKNTKCSHCGYEWPYNGKLELATCPSCHHNTKARNLIKNEVKQ